MLNKAKLDCGIIDAGRYETCVERAWADVEAIRNVEKGGTVPARLDGGQVLCPKEELRWPVRRKWRLAKLLRLPIQKF